MLTEQTYRQYRNTGALITGATLGYLAKMNYGKVKKAKRSFYSKAKATAKRAGQALKDRYTSAGGLGRLVSDVAMLKTAVNSERKYHDQVSLVAGTATDTAPYMLALPWDNLSQGVAENQREGDQVKALWTTFRTILDWAPTGLTTAATCQVRILAVLDTEPRASNAVSATVLRDSILAVTATGPTQITSPYKVLHTATAGAVGGRWKVLHDEVLTLDNANKKQHIVNLSFNHMQNKYKGFRVKYGPSPDDNPADDRLYIILCTDSSTLNDLVITGDYSRFCYVDN